MSQTIVCSDCSTSFSFTDADQAFYAEKGFSPPRRCKPCRTKAKQARESGGGGSSSGGGGYGGGGSSYGGGGYGGGGQRQERQMYDVTCSECGQAAQVPFKPNGVKPVLCRDCFRR